MKHRNVSIFVRWAALFVLSGCTGNGTVTTQGCGSDKDCKGDRICSNGACTPAPSAPSVAPPSSEAAPSAPAETTPSAEASEASEASEATPTYPAPRIGASVPLVVLTEFSNFQCPHSARATRVLRDLLEEYGGPEGTLSYEWRHFPLGVHPRSEPLALSAAAAHKQGRFWQLHDALFSSPQALSEAELRTAAQGAGLDLARWDEDRQSENLPKQIERERHIAIALGAVGTPVFFINGRKVPSGPLASSLKPLIEDELAKGRAKQEAGIATAEIAAMLQRENNPEFARYLLDGESPPEPTPVERPVPETVWKVQVRRDDPAQGPADALVTLVEFGDFECPFCARYRHTLRELQAAYPDELRLVFKQNPLTFHPHARLAAEASLAAHAQGKFWPYHDRLYDAQRALTAEDLIAHARALGLDEERFKQDLDSHTFRARIENDQSLAARVEAVGTPNLFINGRKVVGARSLNQLKALVDEELAKARQMIAAGTPKSEVYLQLIANGQSHRTLADNPLSFDLSHAPTQGPSDAPIHLTVFADFQCPFASRLVPILERVGQQFPGKIRTTFKHFPQDFHPRAKALAMTTICAHEQGRFWELHSLLFDLNHQKDLEEAALRNYVQQAGLDSHILSNCLASERPGARLEADLSEARRAEVRGTPTVFINGRRFTSPTGYNDRSFVQVFGQLLNDEPAVPPAE